MGDRRHRVRPGAGGREGGYAGGRGWRVAGGEGQDGGEADKKVEEADVMLALSHMLYQVAAECARASLHEVGRGGTTGRK